MTDVTNSPAANKIEVFKALCWSRALRWRSGHLRGLGGDDWIGHAVDPLQRWAESNGVVEAIGQDTVQSIIADAFDRARQVHDPYCGGFSEFDLKGRGFDDV